jgi:transposase
MQQRMEKTFEKRIEKETKAANASLRSSMAEDSHANLMREKRRRSGYRIRKIINLRNWSSKFNPRESMAR